MKKLYLALVFMTFLGSFSFGQQPTSTPQGMGRGNGIGNGSGSGQGNGKTISTDLPSGEVVGIRISSKPRPNYTDEARKNAVEGVVRLRVTFLASGEIGTVSPVSALKDGLTEQAIAAAREIKFEPARKNGVAVTQVRVIEYNFSIYFGEDDEDLAQNAEILEISVPQDLADDVEFKNLGGNLKLSVAFGVNGTARLLNQNPIWSRELIDKLNAAVAKIKFKPAIHQNGNPVLQVKEIELKAIK